MPHTLTTARLILRPLEAADAPALFAMDSDPEVHAYLGNQPVTQLAQIEAAIAMIQAQYAAYGVGRLAVVLQTTGQCIGWAGLKYMAEPVNGHAGHLDLGYRLQRAHWGTGYATEAATAALDLGFGQLAQPTIHAMAHLGNRASRHVLHKLGFAEGEAFEHEDIPHVWLRLDAETWQTRQRP